MKKIVLGVLGVTAIILTCCTGYWYLTSTKGGIKLEDNQSVSTSTVPEINVATESDFYAPEGWRTYISKHIEPKIAISYPSTWNVTEDELNLLLTGDGYRMIINNAGSEVTGNQWTHPTYFIGGYETWRTWESFVDGQYRQILSMRVLVNDNVIIRVATPSDSKKITDQILSSIIFLGDE